MEKKFTRALLLVAFAFVAGGCKQQIPAKVDQQPVFGKIQEIKTVASEKQLMFPQGGYSEKLNWGTATSYYLKVDDAWYPLQWEEASKFKGLKVGDSVNLHPSEYVSCMGENDLKPTCKRLMKVYKSDHFIPPLQVAP